MQHSVRALRIYCEMIPWSCLSRVEVLQSLNELALSVLDHTNVPVELVWKVDLDDPQRWVDRLHILRTHAPSIRNVWLWGQLGERDGVFANAQTWPQLVCAWREALVYAQSRSVTVDGLLMDLEPEIETLRSALDGQWRAALGSLRSAVLDPVRWDTFTSDAERDVRSLHEEFGVPTIAACFPCALGGSLRALEHGARLLSTPITTPDRTSIWSGLACMNYPSFAFPLLGGERNPAARVLCASAGGLLARWHVRASKALGVEADVICGLNAPGIFQTEPAWSSPERMEPFLRACVRARPDVLSLFNLTGVLFGCGRAPTPKSFLRRSLVKRWVDVLVRVLGSRSLCASY